MSRAAKINAIDVSAAAVGPPTFEYTRPQSANMSPEPIPVTTEAAKSIANPNVEELQNGRMTDPTAERMAEHAQAPLQGVDDSTLSPAMPITIKVIVRDARERAFNTTKLMDWLCAIGIRPALKKVV